MDPNTPQDRKRILMCISGLTHYFELDIQAGIRRFALTQPGWDLGYIDIQREYETHLQDALDWDPQGILIVTKPSQVLETVEPQHLPTVVIDRYHERPPGRSCIAVDDIAIGQRAAEYFLQNRFEHFALAFATKNPRFSQYRCRGFIETLSQQGKQPSQFELEKGTTRIWHKNPKLEQWLHELPKPVGLYCVQDVMAQRIMELCGKLGIRIPAEVSVVGTDNHRMICESFRPTLSSIPQPLEACGYRAAELLWEQIHMVETGARPEVVCEWIPPGEVTERQSSSLRAIADPDIAIAVNYIQDHALSGGTIAMAAEHAGLNRRVMERGFKRHLGVTPGGYLREVKLKHAKQLLAETDLRMSDIAEACLVTQERFATFFREETGMTPSEYRRSVNS